MTLLPAVTGFKNMSSILRYIVLPKKNGQFTPFSRTYIIWNRYSSVRPSSWLSLHVAEGGANRPLCFAKRPRPASANTTGPVTRDHILFLWLQQTPQTQTPTGSSNYSFMQQGEQCTVTGGSRGDILGYLGSQDRASASIGLG